MLLNEGYRHCPLSARGDFSVILFSFILILVIIRFSASTRVDRKSYAHELKFLIFLVLLELKSKTDADNTFLIKEKKFEKWEKKEKSEIFEKIMNFWSFWFGFAFSVVGFKWLFIDNSDDDVEQSRTYPTGGASSGSQDSSRDSHVQGKGWNWWW